jgi:poly-gamma-glutamate capsule biosynthesis protein CapA/YwtB (metallophosphatase superfamily)
MAVEHRCVSSILSVLASLALAGCALVDGSPSGQVSGRARSGSSRPNQLKGGAVTIAAVGDTMLGMTPTLPPSPASYFSRVKRQLSGDIVFGNLEGTLTDVSESPKCGAGSSECFAFRAPPEFGQALRAAGFTLMSNANNHSFDYGQAGEEETLRALERAGIFQTGLPGEITTVRAAGLRLAFVGFAPYDNTASLTDLTTARDLIRDAAEHADIVVCAFHAGAEGTDAQHVTGEEEIYLGEDRGNPEEFAHMAIDAGADLILGSGPHVLRGMEIYRRRLIAYSLGNFSGFHNFALEGSLGESVVLRATLAGDGSFETGRLASVRLVEAGQPVPDPNGAGAELISTLSDEDFGRTAVSVDSDGRLRSPARPASSARGAG